MRFVRKLEASRRGCLFGKCDDNALINILKGSEGQEKKLE